MTKQVTQMVVKTIKANYNYKYNNIDCNNKTIANGFIYILDGNKYFIDNKETYFKTIK
jgi:hypothetical protein